MRLLAKVWVASLAVILILSGCSRVAETPAPALSPQAARPMMPTPLPFPTTTPTPRLEDYQRQARGVIERHAETLVEFWDLFGALEEAFVGNTRAASAVIAGLRETVAEFLDQRNEWAAIPYSPHIETFHLMMAEALDLRWQFANSQLVIVSQILATGVISQAQWDESRLLGKRAHTSFEEAADIGGNMLG